MARKPDDRDFLQAPAERISLINGLNGAMLAVTALAAAVLGIAVASRLVPAALIAGAAFLSGISAALWTVVHNINAKSAGSRPMLLRAPLTLFLLQIVLLAAGVITLLV